MNILLGVTGSVAAKLTPKFQKILIEAGHSVKTVYTEAALNFVDPLLAKINEFDDSSEWTYYRNTDKVLHIDLVKWADRFIVAPCTANTLCKISTGICDNLLTSCVRAWPNNKTKIILAPAMNCEMWNKDVTTNALVSLMHDYTLVNPVNKTLFCGDVGIGAMAPIEDIIKQIYRVGTGRL